MTSLPLNIEGVDLGGGWTGGPAIPRDDEATGGWFSISFRATHESGREGFLKALDLSKAAQAPNSVDALYAATGAFRHERDLLRKCEEAAMEHVVRTLSAGSVRVGTGPLSEVHFIIFELADGDVRRAMARAQQLDTAWSLRTLHHAAVGLSQLHSSDIAHQDLKPSNVLTFAGGVSKLADLGCASYRSSGGPRDGCEVAGDLGYAPPELLFFEVDSDWRRRRVGCDLYHLGSLVVFVHAGVTMTAAILSELLPTHRPGMWTGTYREALPYVTSAFATVLDRFDQPALGRYRDRLVDMVQQLCHPDPEQRGDRIARSRGQDPLRLERFISALNLMAVDAETSLSGRR